MLATKMAGSKLKTTALFKLTRKRSKKLTDAIMLTSHAVL
jgi:hypothetical protein